MSPARNLTALEDELHSLPLVRAEPLAQSRVNADPVIILPRPSLPQYQRLMRVILRGWGRFVGVPAVTLAFLQNQLLFRRLHRRAERSELGGGHEGDWSAYSKGLSRRKDGRERPDGGGGWVVPPSMTAVNNEISSKNSRWSRHSAVGKTTR